MSVCDRFPEWNIALIVLGVIFFIIGVVIAVILGILLFLKVKNSGGKFM